MTNNNPLIRAAAEYLTMVDFPESDHSDLYAGHVNGTSYRVDGNLDIARLVDVIAQAERRSIVDELIHYGDVAPESQKSGFYAASHRVRDRMGRS